MIETVSRTMEQFVIFTIIIGSGVIGLCVVWALRKILGKEYL